MATIVDKEEKHFVRKLAFTELQKLNHDIGDFLIKWDKEFDDFPTEEQREENEKQLIMEFGDKNERTD